MCAQRNILLVYFILIFLTLFKVGAVGTDVLKKGVEGLVVNIPMKGSNLWFTDALFYIFKLCILLYLAEGDPAMAEEGSSVSSPGTHMIMVVCFTSQFII